MGAMERSTGLLAGVLVAAAAPAQTVRFEKIPMTASANDMSPDGRWIVGEADQDDNGFSDGTYLLDTVLDQMTILPPLGLTAVAVSDDGQVVLGDIPDPEGIGSNVAAIWTQATGWQSLGALPNALGCPSRSDGYELSADGSVAVGLSWDGCSGRGFIWTESTGMLELEPLANGGNRASVISADGTLVGGFAQGNFSRTPAMWDDTTAGQLLHPFNGDAQGEVLGMRDDGSILLGTQFISGNVFSAVMWTDPAEPPRVLGGGSILPGWASIAMDIADNDTIVGFDHLLGNRRAWIQPLGEGPLLELTGWVESQGGEVPDEIPTQVCQAISADGSVVIGHSFPGGGWRVLIDSAPACPWDCGNDDGVVDTVDFLALLAEWGRVGTACDFDGTGVDTVDFLELLANWGTCP